MIRSLEIRDLVVIPRTEIAPRAGLTAITGESGAGKSVLARALGLLLGAPADPSEVRPGARAALVQATLGVPEGLWESLDDDDPVAGLAELVEDRAEVVIARRVPAEGRARALVDGQAAPREAVAALARACLRVVGQAEARRLVSPAAQMAALDAFAGEEAVALARELAVARRRLAAISRAIAAERATQDAVVREREELEETVADIGAAGLDPEEDAALRAERDRLRHASGLLAAAARAAEALSPESGQGGALEACGVARRDLDEVVELDPALVAPRDDLVGAEASLQEAAMALRGYIEALEADPGRLEAIEERLAEYARLDRRYGPGVDTVLERAAAAERRLAEIDAGRGTLERLEAERAGLLADARDRAGHLAELRAAAAPRLAADMAAELAELAMPQAHVDIALERDGAVDPPVETCTVMLQVNPGLPAGPLADVASGGELSRALLALHSLAVERGQGAWVFDEVDAGIGGETAVAVGRRLARLAEGRQVIVITHLPQVAALADHHYRLAKGVDDEGRTATTVEPIEGEDLVAELCRMLGSSPDDAGARRHVTDLIARRASGVSRAA